MKPFYGVSRYTIIQNIILKYMNTLEKNPMEDVSDLKAQIAELSEKLNTIKMLADREQGRWADMDTTNNVPAWAIPFKKIVGIIEN